MDGITGMAGNGPSTGIKKQCGLLAASVDGVALDAVAAHLMGFRENDVDMIRFAGERGLGKWHVRDIEVLGDSLESCLQEDFPLPSNHLTKFVPQFLADLFGGFVWVKPVADPGVCTGCGICAASCPVNAIEMRNNKPVMDYKTCINCLCCDESCPEGAIEQKRSWLARQIS